MGFSCYFIEQAHLRNVGAGQNSPHFCTVEKLGPTEGPNISTVFILNENMVGHNEVPIIPMVPTFRCTH